MYCPNCGFLNEDAAFSCSKCDTSLSSISLKYIEQSPYVGFWRRFGAFFIDWIAVSILSSVIGIVVVVLGIAFPWLLSETILNLFSVLVAFLYYASFESSIYQATIGKRAVGIKVTDLKGNRISFKKAFFRVFIKSITGLMLGIGYLAIPFSKKKQGLYDMAAGTVVVYK
jgi:uncharacterized RDD family membrane protein YckC